MNWNTDILSMPWLFIKFLHFYEGAYQMRLGSVHYFMGGGGRAGKWENKRLEVFVTPLDDEGKLSVISGCPS